MSKFYNEVAYVKNLLGGSGSEMQEYFESKGLNWFDDPLTSASAFIADARKHSYARYIASVAVLTAGEFFDRPDGWQFFLPTTEACIAAVKVAKNRLRRHQPLWLKVLEDAGEVDFVHNEIRLF